MTVNGKNIHFEEVHNEILNELQYVITWHNGSTFVMAYNEEIDRLEVQRPAPYVAYEYEQQISDAIEAVNL